MKKELILKRSIIIDASPEKVWEALTKPEWTRKYMFDCDAVSDWKKGSPLTWKGYKDGKVYVKGILVDIDPGKLMQFTTFAADSDLEDIPSNYTTVTYKLSPLDGKTKLVVEDGDFAKVGDGEKRYKDSIGGWDLTLPKLKETVENSILTV